MRLRGPSSGSRKGTPCPATGAWYPIPAPTMPPLPGPPRSRGTHPFAVQVQQLLAAAVAHVTEADAPREAQLRGGPSLRAEVLLTTTAKSKAGQGVVVGKKHNCVDQLGQGPTLLTDLQQLLQGVDRKEASYDSPPTAPLSLHQPLYLLHGASGPRQEPQLPRSPRRGAALPGGSQPIRSQEGMLASETTAVHLAGIKLQPRPALPPPPPTQGRASVAPPEGPWAEMQKDTRNL